MPIYEYECGACGHQFEEWQRMSDPPIRKCPKCGRRKVQKLVSRSAFHLKGGGWYVTDYGGKKSGSSGNGESGKGGGSSDKTESKGEAKGEKAAAGAGAS